MKNHYNLMLKRSIILMISFMGVIFAVGTVLLWKFDFSIWWSFGLPVFIAGFQFLIGPFLIDLVYDIEFKIKPDYFTPEVMDFIKSTCNNLNIPVPKLGLIKDGNPNAFTYGHIPKNARLVVTSGLMEMLTEEELEAVIAHELGHIKHYDFIMMTLVSLIPMILYQLYLRTRDRASASFVVGICAYMVYVLSGFVVLSFSRIREFYADSFSKSIMKDGEILRKALIKIAYGTAKREKGKIPRVSPMGFTNNIQNDAFMLSSFKAPEEGKLDKKLMRWDFRNLWGRWYELNSTHPLTARRILALTGEQVEESRITLKDLGKFLVEAVLLLLPWITFFIILTMVNWNSMLNMKIINGLLGIIKNSPIFISVLGMTILIRYYYSYRQKYKEYSIYELLSREDASPVKGIPAIIEGTAIGKGIPGLFFSEDIVIDDGTGIMLVDYRQPLKIFEFLFGVFKVDQMKDCNVKVVGWYKRGIRPYFVCRHILLDDKKMVSFNYIFTQIFGYLLLVAGAILTLLIR